ncbi:MAG: MarR family transcriptional regulator [Bacillota bacterium]|nr:MarR family transcriptional regulator [Bacillota bacterium]
MQDDVNNNLGYLLSKAARVTKWEFNNKLKEFSLTAAQWSVIKDLSMQDRYQDDLEKVSPAAVAKRLYVDRPTMSGIIERLVKGDWLEKFENPKDRRSFAIKLTGKAKNLIVELNQLGDKVMEQAVDGFTDDEIAQLKYYLTKIIKNLT